MASDQLPLQLPDLPSAWPLATGQDLRDELLAAYGDPSRGYHDTTHLAEVLARVDVLAAAGEAFAPLPVRLAVWFHDSVYDGERDAEERSAVWAEEALAALCDDATVAEVVRLVRLTEGHRPGEDDAEGCVLSDADLGILAASPERYAAYVAAVRTEYAHLDDATFHQGRALVLADLLDKPRLFHTGYALEHWEGPARANASRELEGLQALLPG
jgi:predicted metal-dependent HD superfamily phosphohydrolase